MGDINATLRNPHVLKKLIRFNGYVPVNIIDKSAKTVIPAKVEQKYQREIADDRSKGKLLDIDLDGKHYHAKVDRILTDAIEQNIDEVELVVE